jgi:hypothetical protein
MGRRDFQRRPPKKELGQRILIACEGLATEPRYFEAIRKHFRLSTVNVFLIRHAGSDPHSVVVAAIDKKEEQEDEGIWIEGSSMAWAVFDGDEHIQNNLQNWNNALQKASKNKINLAISNPCFEFWYLIHFQDHSAYITRTDAMRLLKKYVSGYEKAKVLYPEPLASRTQDAIQRAKKLQNKSLEEYSNPCCYGVAELVEILLKLQKS